ncbi:hypothetical protein C8F04DRAFT_1073797 [Mycena alexandri]|uniref:F-box domain-containing protein n=1 Tax=Mycena alexandri TaxID=1745969 RepID=A0AAD6TB03_9AGAR|nr:hypothetical protein C8F04DRAFT_1073797 [Mycena alexandri]
MGDGAALELGSTSPFHHLLHTNYIPTADEALRIRELCTKPRQELYRLEAAIARTQARLQNLQREHRSIKALVDAHVALLSPMRNLPPEVLQLIFIKSLPSDRNAVIHASEAPLLLGRVCSGWRRIAFATPELWASVHVVCPPMDYAESASPRTRTQRQAMEAWLARSGACPLSVSIWVSREAGFGGAAVAAASPFVEAILPLSHRWKNIELRVPTDSLDSFHYLQGSDVPLLQTVAITNGGSLARDDWSANLLFLQHAPRLHTLSLTHEGNVNLPSFPWAQLTALSLSPTQEFFGLDTETTLTILSQCINLRTCTLHFPPSDQASTFPPRVFTLPHLSVLAVRATNFPDSDYALIDIFDSLILPALQTLEVEDRNGDLDIFSALSRLLSRSPCHLRKLKLNDIIATADDLIDLLDLQSLRSLTELVVHDRGRDWRDEGGYMLSDGLLRAMSRDSALCPNLLTVKFAQCSDFSDEMLLEFLTSRSRPAPETGVRLQTAEISIDRAIEFEFDRDAAVRQLVEDGLQVVIRHEDDSWDVRVSPWEGLNAE